VWSSRAERRLERRTNKVLGKKRVFKNKSRGAGKEKQAGGQRGGGGGGIGAQWPVGKKERSSFNMKKKGNRASREKIEMISRRKSREIKETRRLSLSLSLCVCAPQSQHRT
jgi:hypothetical protein